MMKYLKTFSFVLLFMVLISSAGFAQNDSGLKAKKYNTEKDSLTILKQNLTSQTEKLNAEVDSLKTISADLDKKLDKANSELHGLKGRLFVKKYGRESGDRVLNGQIWKGMTKEMVMDSWGKPDKKHKDVYKWGTFEQWYYGDVTYFFKNGKLIDWEEKKKEN